MQGYAADFPEHVDIRVLPPGGLLELVRGIVVSGGSLWIRVTGISMNPIIREGDSVLLVRPRRAPRRGDVVFVDVRGMPVLHRVRRNTAGVLVTRGDATTRDDEQVSCGACIAQAVAARRGDVTMALTPTLRFGIAPFLWLIAWTFRARILSSMARTFQPLSRALGRPRL